MRNLNGCLYTQHFKNRKKERKAISNIEDRERDGCHAKSTPDALNRVQFYADGTGNHNYPPIVNKYLFIEIFKIMKS